MMATLLGMNGGKCIEDPVQGREQGAHSWLTIIKELPAVHAP